MTGSYTHIPLTFKASETFNPVPEPHGNHGFIMACWVHIKSSRLINGFLVEVLRSETAMRASFRDIPCSNNIKAIAAFLALVLTHIPCYPYTVHISGNICDLFSLRFHVVYSMIKILGSSLTIGCLYLEL